METQKIQMKTIRDVICVLSTSSLQTISRHDDQLNNLMLYLLH